MSIYRPQELRYAKLDALKEERALMNNYYQDIIRQYGVDLTYYRRDTDFSPSTNGISSEMIYGYKNKPTYTKKTNIRSFIDGNNMDYNFLLNGVGFGPSDKFTFYFGINDFAVSFVSELGQFQSFKVDECDGRAYLREDREHITIPFSSEIMSGTIKVHIDRDVIKKNESTEIINATVPCYSVAFNPYIYRSFSTDYKDGYYSANIVVDYDSTRGNNISYKVHGDILYSNFFENDRIITEIHPNVGDVVEIDYHTNDMNSEQYEITEVISRKPTNSDGLSPFLGKYVYKCTAVRRIISGEDLPKEKNAEESHNKLTNYEKQRADEINSNYDWSSENASSDSNVYGKYKKSDDFDEPIGTDSLNITKIFDYSQYSKKWNEEIPLRTPTYNICSFTDGSSLYTNGSSLFWKHNDGSITKIASDNTSTKLPVKIPELMYLRVIDGQLLFTSYINKSIQLTHFTNTQKSESTFIDGFQFRDVGYVSKDGFYIFKNDKIAINSFNDKELVVFSGKLNTKEVIATNN